MTIPTGTDICWSCGVLCAVAGSEAAALPDVLIEGLVDGRPWCDTCIANRILVQFTEGLDALVYISGDGRTFQTWAGTKLGTVHELGGIGGIWSFQSIERLMARLPVKCVHWSGVTTDGVLVYGRTMGHNMAATAHVRRRKGRLQVEAGSTIAMEGVN